MSLFYECYAEHFHKTIWGDKTPSFFRMIPVLHSIFPQAKFIHIIRDGRDTYLSWRKTNILRQNISVGALEWAYKIKRIRSDLHNITSSKYLEIHYEDLVRYPQSILNNVCRFLDIGFESEMLDFWETSSQFIRCHHSQSIFEPVTTKHIEKWKNVLTKNELRKFEYIAGKALAEYGYELVTEKSLPPFLPVSMMWEIATGLPKRFTHVIITAIILKISSKFGLTTKAAGGGRPPEHSH